MSDNPPRQLTCFVAMGFGKKTDFESGRVLDLNASYQNLIKPAVEAAGLKCVRADEIKHSGLIDDPMYEQLFNAEVVVADLSTSNRNAIYELGVRHALRPHTTVIIAEEGLMKSPLFDLSHIVIRTYKHLGEDIGVSEMRRFTSELTGAIKEILAKEPRDNDSPVYRYLTGLIEPSIPKEDVPVPVDSTTGRTAAVANNADAGADSYGEVMSRMDREQKKGKQGWYRAKMWLEELRESRKAAIEAQDKASPTTAKTEDPTILQRLALATYKSEFPTLQKSLEEARGFLVPLEPYTSNDSETLGLWGSVHKQLWEITRRRADLDEAVRAYERGFYIRNDYYNGINYAFLLNVRAANSDDPAEAIADFVQARRVRREVVKICNAWLANDPEPAGPDATEQVLDKYRANTYWALATLAEAYIGLEEPQGDQRLADSFALPVIDWMKETTEKQVAALRALLAEFAPQANLAAHRWLVGTPFRESEKGSLGAQNSSLMARSNPDFDLEWVPLRIFVVWHPAFKSGLELANDLHSWFGGPNRAWHRAGLGIPVMFWTSQDSETPPGSIPADTQEFTVVVPLVDEHFAALRSWRDWIEKGIPAVCHIRFWAVHPAAFQIERLSPINPLGTRDCAGEALRRLLTESCSLLLVAGRRLRREGSLSFFISYARNDGGPIASDVRRALLEYGNVQVFMDVHDIEPGRGWQERLERGIEDGAAMLAIVTDEYSERAWCRRELREFRTPVRDEANGGLWWLRPVFVLDALSGSRARSMFEIGSAPTTRWQKESAIAIIDALVRDVLFGEVQRLRASRIAGQGVDVINWVPDTWTILELQRLTRLMRREPLSRIVYPGDGIPQLELQRLCEVFPGLELQSFEETLNR